MNKFYSLLILSLFTLSAFAQVANNLYNYGDITVEPTGLLYVEGSVIVYNGADITGDGIIEIKGDFQQDGTMTFGASGERLVKFTKGTGTQTISSTLNTEVEFYNVDVNTPAVITGATYTSGGVVSTVNIQVNDTMDLALGDIIMNDKELTFGANATISNYGASNILYFSTGSLNRKVASTKNYEFPIFREGEGYVLAEIDITAMPGTADVIKGKFVPNTNLGTMFHNGQCHNVLPGGAWGQTILLNQLIDNFGYWQIDPFTSGGVSLDNAAGWDYDANLHVPYLKLQNFLNAYGSDYYKIIKIKSHNAGVEFPFNPNTAGQWEDGINYSGDYCSGLVAKSNYNSQAAQDAGIVATNLHSFSRFGGAGNNGGGGLPVELLYLTANPIDNSYIRLDWETAVEIDNSGFEVLRSEDGVNFTQIGWVDGNGNATNNISYLFNDFDVQPNKVYYYRLNQIDFDGANELTYIVSASITTDNVFVIGEFVPNPTMNGTAIEFNTSVEKEIDITIYNTLGQRVVNRSLNLSPGINRQEFDLSSLAAGTYHAVIVVENEIFNKKVVVTR